MDSLPDSLSEMPLSSEPPGDTVLPKKNIPRLAVITMIPNETPFHIYLRRLRYVMARYRLHCHYTQMGENLLHIHERSLPYIKMQNHSLYGVSYNELKFIHARWDDDPLECVQSNLLNAAVHTNIMSALSENFENMVLRNHAKTHHLVDRIHILITALDFISEIVACAEPIHQPEPFSTFVVRIAMGEDGIQHEQHGVETVSKQTIEELYQACREKLESSYSKSVKRFDLLLTEDICKYAYTQCTLLK